MVFKKISCEAFYNKISFEILARIINYIHINNWDVFTPACPNFNNGFVNPPRKLGHG